MGYNLGIGEAVTETDEDGDVIVWCEPVRKDDAPAFGDPTDYTNERWPSYSAWHDCMKKLGMMDVMFNQRNGGAGQFKRNGNIRMPLLQEHPGSTVITVEHVEEVEELLAKYKATNSGHLAKYPPPLPGARPMFPGSDLYSDDQLTKDPIYDASLCRGEWLAYWLRWAIENCKQPVFVNS